MDSLPAEPQGKPIVKAGYYEFSITFVWTKSLLSFLKGVFIWILSILERQLEPLASPNKRTTEPTSGAWKMVGQPQGTTPEPRPHFRIFSSVKFICSVVSDSLQSRDCSTPGLAVHHQLLELAQTHVHWVGDSIQPSHLCHLVPFPSHPPSFPASGSFPVSHFFTYGSQSIEASASASVVPMNIQDWFPLGLTGLIFWQSKGLSRVFSNTTALKHQFFMVLSLLYGTTFASIHDY